MEDYDGSEWVFHELYVDETQDFTQAELSLLMRCCQNPNAMFLTGTVPQATYNGQCKYLKVVMEVQFQKCKLS